MSTPKQIAQRKHITLKTWRKQPPVTQHGDWDLPEPTAADVARAEKAGRELAETPRCKICGGMLAPVHGRQLCTICGSVE